MKLLVQFTSLLAFALSTSAFLLNRPAVSAVTSKMSCPTSTSLSMASMSGKLCPELPLTPSTAGNELAIAVPGVQRCIVGYSGGLQPDPTYQNIMDYTEALLVEYDPAVISFQEILKKWRSFGQPYPAKTQYKWAVFAMNPEQEQIAKEFCAGEKHIAIEPVTKFYMAEEYHQDFMKKTGNLRY